MWFSLTKTETKMHRKQKNLICFTKTEFETKNLAKTKTKLGRKYRNENET